MLKQSVYLQVSVDNEAVVHVFQTQDDFSGVKTHVFLDEDAVLRQVIVQVTSWMDTNKRKDGVSIASQHPVTQLKSYFSPFGQGGGEGGGLRINGNLL